MVNDVAIAKEMQLDIWFQQSYETNAAYHAFEHFRDMPSYERSVAGSARLHKTLCSRGSGKASARLYRWKEENSWENRVFDYDHEMSVQRLARRARGIERSEDSYAALGGAMRYILGEKLKILSGDPNAIKSLKMSDIPNWLRAAMEVEFMSLGRVPEDQQAAANKKPPMTIKFINSKLNRVTTIEKDGSIEVEAEIT